MSACEVLQLVYRILLLQSPESRKQSSVNFWMDTFCIPTEYPEGPVEQQPRRLSLKQEAITLMTPIYARAEKVLVLNAELDRLNHLDISFTELTARLRICLWTSRAWTLQEGSLASRLSFQLQNGYLFAYEGQQRLDETLKIAIWNLNYDVQTEILDECRKAWFLPTVGDYKPDRYHHLSARDVQFMDVWNSMLDKDTTKAKDMHVIVAK